jgi:SAM-dependent methyltransferase
MDLRRFQPTEAQQRRAASALDYQPFIISDDVQTGVAYSWFHGGDPRVKPPLLFRRGGEHDWERVTDANRRLAAMYDDLLDEAARRFPKGSLLDIACNNGYFPVGAELRGMRGTGSDAGFSYWRSFRLLNEITGASARYRRSVYDPGKHSLRAWSRHGPRVRGRYDVIVASAIMCHIPDPLHFLAELARLGDAILFWGQVVESENLLISYRPPHAALSQFRTFPICFNDNTRLSRGLFYKSLELLGFRDIVEIPARDSWLKLPYTAETLDDELRRGSRHVALLALR